MSRTNDANQFDELNIYTAEGIHFGGMVWLTSSDPGDVVRLGAQYPSRALLTQTGLDEFTVRLPDARMYPVGLTDIAILHASIGVGGIAVEDASGGSVGSVGSGVKVFALLVDNTTQAGQWILLVR